MHEKILKLSTGEEILIFDNIFKPDEVHYWQEYAEMSLYTMKPASSGIISQQADTFFQSNFSSDDLDNFGILRSSGFLKIKHLFGQRQVSRSWIVTSNPVSHFYFHPDNHSSCDGKSLLYYMNNKWDRDWGGETLFCNSDNEIELAVEFKPNRVVVFDSHLYHRSSPPSIKSNAIRMTFVAQFTHPIATVKD